MPRKNATAGFLISLREITHSDGFQKNHYTIYASPNGTKGTIFVPSDDVKSKFRDGKIRNGQRLSQFFVVIDRNGKTIDFSKVSRGFTGLKDFGLDSRATRAVIEASIAARLKLKYPRFDVVRGSRQARIEQYHQERVADAIRIGTAAAKRRHSNKRITRAITPRRQRVAKRRI